MPGQRNFFRKNVVATIIGAFCLAALSCSTTATSSGADNPQSLKALYALYKIPSKCDTTAHWEGKPVCVKGFVDPDNIFDKQHFPNLPYEKFRVIDKKGNAIEVWVKSEDSRRIFSTVYLKKDSQIIVNGRLSAVKMPIGGACRLGAKMWIENATQIK